MNININIVNKIAKRDKGRSVYHQIIKGAYIHNIVYSNKLYNNIFKSVEIFVKVSYAIENLGAAQDAFTTM
jgi:hypothetical protein